MSHGIAAIGAAGDLLLEAAEVPACVLDIAERFGPLASMHAALDAAGIGTPCGTVAFFEGRSLSELNSAVSVARRRFPVLQTRLAWRRGRPVLEPHPVGLPGGLWEHQLIPAADGVWLHACWRHAAADGRSMLRFLQAVAAVLGTERFCMPELKRRPAAQPQPMAPWLGRFLSERARSYVRLEDVDPSASCGVTWLMSSPADRDRLLDAAGEGLGVVGPLAAAAAASFCEQQIGSRGGLVSLNVPVARDDLDDLGGFGFGVGSLILPVRVRGGDDSAELGLSISQQIRQLAAEGFDRNLDRFLGRSPLRHRVFGAIRARSRPDPAVVVSWKGRQEIGGADGIRRLACFAGSPTLHVSAHADRNGFSISVASRQSAGARAELLESMAQRLGIRSFRSIDLSELAPDPLLGCASRA